MSPVRVALALALALFVSAAPAASAGSNPEQHDAQQLTLAETALSPSLGMPLPLFSQDCVNGMAGPYPCRNVDMRSSVPLPALGGATGNDIWGWTDSETKREYAIMGTSTSTGFVDVTNPENPVLIGTLPTRGRPDFVLWRDIKVDGDFAYIVSEITRSGLQVFDLRRLRNPGATPTVFTADATYDGFSNAHNISINTVTDFAYVVGTNTCGVNGENGGLHMLDISKPLEPTFAGCATVGTFAPADQGGQPNNYAHDVECVIYSGPDADYTGREICFGSNENAVVVYDVTDKANPRVLSSTGYPNAAYTHQGALTGDQAFFLFGDELDEQQHGVPTTTYILDVRDLDAPPTPVSYEHASSTIDHNMYITGNRTFQSNYMEGLRILEFDTASLQQGQLEEVAFFDVLPGADIAEFAGTWSNYRFPRSGNVVVSTVENQVSGLFVLTPRLDCGKSNPRDDCPTKGDGKR